jgi:hypothetical protein
MRRRINVLVAAVVLLLAAGLVLAAIPKVQQAAARSQCQNNLKQIGLGMHNYHYAYEHFPPATIPNDALLCKKRLSWLVEILPFMTQIGLVIDRDKAWDAEANLVPKSRYQDRDDSWVEHPIGELRLFRCPINPAVAAPGSPGLTHYVGISGVGADAADLPLEYPGVGFFGCQRRPKKEDIKDGLANTIMVMETSTANGPWTAGGFPTTRGLDSGGGPYLGAGGQFSSGHHSTDWLLPSKTVITNVVYADGSVRGLKDSVSPEVLEALVTIVGGEVGE